MSVNFKSIFRSALLLCLLLVVGNLSAQTTAKGTVTDSNGEAVIGATVVEKGNPKNATVTDFDGNFTLKLQKAKQVVISYIGMVAQEVTAGPDMQVKLLDDNAALEEVVVVGYTSKARKDLTGSVGSISGAKLAAVPVSSAAEALQGKIAGVQVTTVDGQPGADINIRVRGGSSVTQSNAPLYIIDGFQAESISDIPPSDIASIDVLKDASLTAIYGAKGGNGVVVVTTKSAKEGKVQVSFNGRLSISKLSKKLDLMGTYDFANFQYDRLAASGKRSSNARYYRYNFGNPNDVDIYQRMEDHDWQDEVLGETPLNYMANVTVGGGTDKFRFNASLTQNDDRGIIKGTGVRRTNLNIKMNIKLSKNLELNLNPRFVYRRDVGGGADKIGAMGLVDVLKYSPTAGRRELMFDNPAAVDPALEENFILTNPNSQLNDNTKLQHQYQYTNQFSLTWKPIKGLMLRSEFSHSIRFRDTNTYSIDRTTTGESRNRASASIVNQTREEYTWTNTASYDLSLKEKHNFSFLIGQEIYNMQYKTNTLNNKLFPESSQINDRRAWEDMGLAAEQHATSSKSTPDRTASFFGQISYNYKHRYLASFTMRADGSTKFAPGEQWGYFPSISGAWVISEEPFMQNIKWIDNLKIRAAFGLVGNNRIDDDMWRFFYASNSTNGPGFAEGGGSSINNGVQWYGANNSTTFMNPKIKWETTITRNLAFDISLFGGRINITPEFYWNTTKDLLYTSAIPSTTGYTRQTQNIGQVTNKGFELAINGDILRGKDYVLSASLTLGLNKKKVDRLNDTDGDMLEVNYGPRWKSSDWVDYYIKVGDEVGLIYGFVYDGIYTADEFDYNTVIGQAIPKPTTVINQAFGDHTTGYLSYSTNANSSDAALRGNSATMPGKIKFKDLNGDGVVDAEHDRTVIGNTNPKVQGGFGLNGQWKDFDFNANFTYMLDFDVLNATAYALSSHKRSNKFQDFSNVLSDFAAPNRWQYTREDGEHFYGNASSKFTNVWEEYGAYNRNAYLWNPGDINSNVANSYFVEDGSFLRCNDITVGYTLPGKLTKKWGISKLRFYASVTNPFIITGYSGYDPEVDIQTSLNPGIDYNRYPRSRGYVFGVNLNF